ncbi:ECU06_0585 [Encephalitozoon cuniculi GB-M1]|uniref:ECU06_0585 protein n=1 Tax=Encephalitozoon cuniculi (strain GB-M1) TaxID=284813 RepID=I7KFX1_ENCCU|nr:uncharacterized protein ECU06_0585 [Encephalitozoon cuniculi GB-M1]UYI27649.1 hypothetical protein J0A71_07g15270 [Encephalitozoon cuniculi]CCI73943.1 ECU06_0585 [Encephalitozoon cuniculi GB-M1]
MLEPETKDVYRPSLRKCILRTMGASFISGYVVGTSFRWIAGSRRDYGQYLGNSLCVAGVCLQLGRRLVDSATARTGNSFIFRRFSPWK